MDSSGKPNYLFHLRVTSFFHFGLVLATSNSILDYNNLVYTNCANNKTHENPTSSLSPALSSLFQELVAQSSNSKFFQTYVGDEKNAISGLFQCRGDISNLECHNCVRSLPDMSNTLCGDKIPARVQLSACYLRYENEDKQGGASTSRLESLHNSCSERRATWSGFEELKVQALAELLGCATSSDNKGFCEMKYEDMHVMAECEGTLEACECGECVSNAVEVAQDECRDSVSGQIYVDHCFLSYSYGSYGTPSNKNRGPLRLQL
ncbi:hypothetical protein RJ639_000043 [Escallonia herrerae]|uniref:Gnk2-homologous domain-containing protein n=1 Tax=Escallonia herrerae TaxID=1293975 RepID=A0AA89BGQ5_9ASTE|nr:hypothetical protein RJ639_000043 [Escallonia herrerae]